MRAGKNLDLLPLLGTLGDMKRSCLLSVCFILLFAAGLCAQNWPSFRGPSASGIADGRNLPVKWDVETSANVLWKASIPGLAHSSPIVWGDRVIVATAIAGDPNPLFKVGQVNAFELSNDTSRQSWRIYCLDRASGKVLWEKIAQEGEPRVKRHPKTTHASATPATDGKHIVVFFPASGGLYCYDLKGNMLWSQDLGVLNANWGDKPEVQWGPASSPIIYKNLAIVQCDIEKDSFIAAFNLETGKKVWSTPRQVISSWSSPTVYEGRIRAELIISGSEDVRGYDPMTGLELWNLKGMSRISIPTPFAADDIIYACSGYPRSALQPIYAILPGSSGNITLKEGSDKSEQIAWSTRKGASYIATPLVYKDYLYVCGYNGVFACYKAKTGERVYEQRLGPGGFFSSSPVAGDGKVYAVGEDGDVYVVKAGPSFELLATNSMGEVCMATPALSRGMIIIRTQSHVYGIGTK
jgi:outer membrane protein assembly factor BamB